MCDDEIGRYYRYLYDQEHKYLNGGYFNKLIRPVWGSHISVIRGEKIPNFDLWEIDKNKIIDFEYEAGIKDNKQYFWISVSCPYLSNLREIYGLSREPRFGFHLTIGRGAE